MDRRPRVGGGRGSGRPRSPDPVDVLAAHLSAGWTLRPPSQSTRDPTPLPDANDVDARTLELRPPRPDDRRDFYRKKDDDTFDRNLDGLAHLRLAHGLVNPPALVPDAHAHVRALSRLAGAISAARLCGVVLRARRWCAVAVREALAAAAAVDALVSKRSGPLRDERAARAAAALAHTARAALDEATTASREKGGGWDDAKTGGDSESDDDSESASESASDLFARAMAAMGGGGGRVGGGRSPSARDGRRQDEGGGGERRLGSQTPSDFFRARLASALDDAAHAVAYHARSCGWLDARVGVGFELASYATAVDAHGAGLDAASAGAAARAARECSNPLLATLRARLREGARLFASEEVRARLPAATLEAANDAKTRANETRAAAPNPPPPPCAPATRRWRDACRAWPCYVYAFAAPTDAAVATLGEASDRWVEVGAGTGYWASLMRARGWTSSRWTRIRPDARGGTSTTATPPGGPRLSEAGRRRR